MVGIGFLVVVQILGVIGGSLGVAGLGDILLGTQELYKALAKGFVVAVGKRKNGLLLKLSI